MPSRPPRDPKPPRKPRASAPRAKSPSASARDQRRAEQHAVDTGKPAPQRSSAPKEIKRPVRTGGDTPRPKRFYDAPRTERPVGKENPAPYRAAATGDRKRPEQSTRSGDTLFTKRPARDAAKREPSARDRRRPEQHGTDKEAPARRSEGATIDRKRPVRSARPGADARPSRPAREAPRRESGITDRKRPERSARPGADARPKRPARDLAPREPARRGADRARRPAIVREAAPERPGAPQRIAKLLARAGVASRREIERMIEERRIAVDGVAIETPATILTSLRAVTVDGNPVQPPAPTLLFRYHKPAGLLTAERDPKGRLTIYDRLPPDLPRVMPVGRLDLNTEGLLLLTTDGEFKRQLELPATGVERSYRARVFGPVSQEQLEDLIEGIEIEGVRYGPIDANLERRTGRNGWVEMRLKEGKNREVRRVLEHLGLQVSRLIRTAYGPFMLGDLPPGAVDEVRQHELVAFRKLLG